MRWIAAAILALILAAGITAAVVRRPRLPAAERGRRLAERTGCFGCHGPGGTRGAANPGRTDKTVPNFLDDVMMFAETPGEIHEWIHNGVTRKRAASRTWQLEKDRGVLRMPAFRRDLEPGDLDAMWAYVQWLRSEARK